jgi:hypothetical protein
MRKALLFLTLAFFTSCSEDNSLDSCTCYIVQRDGSKTLTGVTDCTKNGRVISEAIGTKYVCE